MHFSDPARNLLGQPFDMTSLLASSAYTYITMLALCTFQFWLGLRFRNFVISITVGLALRITGMMMSFEFKSDLVGFFPYILQTFPFITEFQPKLTQVSWTSAGYAMVFLLLGFLDF